MGMTGHDLTLQAEDRLTLALSRRKRYHRPFKPSSSASRAEFSHPLQTQLPQFRQTSAPVTHSVISAPCSHWGSIWRPGQEWLHKVLASTERHRMEPTSDIAPLR